jgi:hypothetical protein
MERGETQVWNLAILNHFYIPCFFFFFFLTTTA